MLPRLNPDMDLAGFCVRERDGWGEIERRGDIVGEATGE